MQWKSWVNEKAGAFFKHGQPRELPSRLGKYLVVDLKHDPDWVWSLRIVTAVRENKKDLFDFRIFDPATVRAEGLDIKNYNALDGHPGSVLFDGWYNKRTWEMEIVPASVLELETQTG